MLWFLDPNASLKPHKLFEFKTKLMGTQTTYVTTYIICFSQNCVFLRSTEIRKGRPQDIVCCLAVFVVFLFHEVNCSGLSEHIMGVIAFLASIYLNQNVMFGAWEVIGAQKVAKDCWHWCFGGTSNMQHSGSHAESGFREVEHEDGDHDSEAREPLMPTYQTQ